MPSSPRKTSTKSELSTEAKVLAWVPGDDDEKLFSEWDNSYDVNDDDDFGSSPDDPNNNNSSKKNGRNEPNTTDGEGSDEGITEQNGKIYLNDDNNNTPSSISKSKDDDLKNNKLSTISDYTDIVTQNSLSKVETPLLKLDDGEENFEEIMRKRNRVRKEREDYHIAHIKVQMSRLEDALAAETKRRVDATTALDELARTQVHEMEERIREQLQQENGKLQTRLGALEERVKALELHWTNDSNNQIELVQSKATDLGKSISQIREDQDMERKARLKREGLLLQQVEEHSKEFEDRWISERNDRIRQLGELENQIVRNEARLALEQKKYEERIETELSSLKEELAIEAVERQAQDEEIVAALNRYTQQLQHSLSILSSD